MAIYENVDWIVVTEEITAGSTKTTYVWVATALRPNNDSLATLKTQPIWQINKYVQTTSWGTVSTNEFQPATETEVGNGFYVRTTDPIFIRDNRATLQYL